MIDFRHLKKIATAEICDETCFHAAARKGGKLGYRQFRRTRYRFRLKNSGNRSLTAVLLAKRLT